MRQLITTILMSVACLMSAQQERLKIVSSASMISDIASNVIGDIHDLEMIVPIGGDPHLHEPTPRDAKLVAGADLILINGLTFEGWINELIENSGTSAKTIVVTEGVDVLTSEEYSNSADPHAWMDASNAHVYAQNIYKAISNLDPDNDKKYATNLASYKTEIEQLDKEIETMILTIPEAKRILVTSHDAFQYFGRRYGIRLEAIMGISTEAEAQTADIRRVNKVIRESGISSIFVESTINPKLIKQLAQDNDISIGGKLYADSLGGPDSPASTYLDMLRYNTKTIVHSLKSAVKTTKTTTVGSNLKLLAFLAFFLMIASIFFFRKMST